MEDKDFKVIDRRGSASGEDKKADAGPGFTMKDSKVNDRSVPPEKIDFSTFVFSLATNTLVQLGLAPDPITKKQVKNLALAKQNIELLTMLREKTKGNLSSDETHLLENLLAEVQIRFVEASK